MRSYRVRQSSLDQQASQRAVLLQAVEFQDHGTHCVALVAGEPLLELPTLDEILTAMHLTRTDIELRIRVGEP